MKNVYCKKNQNEKKLRCLRSKKTDTKLFKCYVVILTEVIGTMNALALTTFLPRPHPKSPKWASYFKRFVISFLQFG